MTDEDNVVPFRDPKPARGRLRKYDRIYGIFAVTSMRSFTRDGSTHPHPGYYSAVSKLGNT